ncbi:unnamed protein product [Closterium sp. NIES-53]
MDEIEELKAILRERKALEKELDEAEEDARRAAAASAAAAAAGGGGGAGGAGGSAEVADDGLTAEQRAERKAEKLRELLAKRAQEQAEKRREAAELFAFGQQAYGRGVYDKSVAILEQALGNVEFTSKLAGEIQLWLAMAYDANGQRPECLALYRKLESNHPMPAIRAQAANMRYIAEAPKLKLSPDEILKVPILDKDNNRWVEGGKRNRGVEAVEEPAQAFASAPSDVRLNLLFSGAGLLNEKRSQYIGVSTTQGIEFILDSGATHTVLKDQTAFVPYQAPTSLLGADSSFSIQCHGSSTVSCPAFPSGTVTGICAPTLRYYLLAQREIQHARAITIFPNDVDYCDMFDVKTGLHLARFTLNSNNLYTLVVPPVQTCSLTNLPLPSSDSPSCHCRLLNDKTMLFHNRLGHINFRALSDLATKQLLHGLPASLPQPPSLSGPPCLDCALSKLREQPHPPTESTSTTPLDRVHMDLWGPAPVRSRGGHFYFLVIVDDYSRYVSVHLLSAKSEAPPIIMEWARQAHSQFKTKIKILHSDGGGEFRSNTLKAFCSIEGIRQTFTLPDSPQQNGVAESRNRIHVQIARCLLTHASAPPSLWGYAMLHAAALHNLDPHPHHTHTTPAELWTGQKPSVRPLRVWGCTSYVLLNSQARRAAGGKLAPKTITCVHLGHNLDLLDYLFLHPTTNKLSRSRDVFFDESHPFYPSSIVSPSPPPPSLTWADFDSLPPATSPSPPLPAPSTVSDPPSPASPSSTTQSPPLLPAPEPIPLKTYQRRPHAAAPPPNPAPAPDPAAVPDAATAPAASPPPAPPPSPIAGRTRSRKAPKPLSLFIRVSLNPPPVGGDYSLMPSLLEDRHEELIEIDSAIHALCSLFPDIAESPTLNFSDNPSIPTPLTYAEAVSGPYATQWLGAIVAECEAFIHTGTFTDVSPPSGVNIVKGKWVFRVKQLPGEFPVFKARYCAKGFTQKHGLDFFETFSPTAKPPTLRALLDVAARDDMEVDCMDVSSAFLQGILREEIYMERAEGFPAPFPPGTVWKLNRPVYGLKQAPREWHNKLKSTLGSLDFHPSTSDPSLFIRATPSRFFILVYVDDMILVTKDQTKLAAVKTALGEKLAMKDLGKLTNYLGMVITRDRIARTITLSQKFYINNVLTRFKMLEAASMPTPLSLQHQLTAPSVPSPEPCDEAYPELVGSLMYAMMCTRPDFAYPVSVLSRYVAPGRFTSHHWSAAKRVLRYLKGTQDYVLTLGGSSPVRLEGYSDSSYADDQSDRRSSQGYCFSLGSGVVSWRSTRSSSVSLSTCEAELYAGTMVAQEARWLSFLLAELGYPQPAPTLWCDNQSTIHLTKDPVFHGRTKHIEVRHYFLRELVQREQLKAEHIASDCNLADLFTKSLVRQDHYRLLSSMGVGPPCG